MRKRLHYVMPLVPLLKYRQRNEVQNPEGNDGPENDNDTVLLAPKPIKSHVGTIAKRIAQEERKKRKAYE